MDSEFDTSHRKWNLSELFEIPGPWSGGKIVGTLRFIDQDRMLVYHHFDGNEETHRQWKTSEYDSRDDAYAVGYEFAHEYCYQRNILLNQVRMIAPNVIEMKVDNTTTIFDDMNLGKIISSTWLLVKDRRTQAPFAKSTRLGKTVFLHRLIWNYRGFMWIRHRNGNTLCNLNSNYECLSNNLHIVDKKSKRTVPKPLGVFKEIKGTYQYWTATWIESGVYCRQRFRIFEGLEEDAERRATETRKLSLQRTCGLND
jgi:hypothetical protein